MIPGEPFARDVDEQVVLLGSRPHPTAAELEALAALAGQGAGGIRAPDPAGAPDPARVVELAMRARTVPQLARNLTAALGGALPPEWAPLRRRSEAVTRHNLARILCLLRLTDTFDRAGIPFLPFKGPVLAREVYGDTTLRQYKDLDILVAPGHLPEAVAQLREEGYRERHPARALTPAQLRALPRWFRNTQLSMVHQEARVEVELHWTLFPRLRFPAAAELAEAPTEVTLGSRTVRTLRPEALFLYLCAHGSKHGWMRVSWVADVAAFLRSERADAMDWKEVLELGHRQGLTPAPAFGALMAEAAMDTPLPPALAAAVAPHRRDLVPHLARAGRAMWSADPDGSLSGIFERTRGAFGGRATGTFRYLASLSLPGLHLLDSRPLPAPLFPLYLAENLRHLATRGLLRAMGRAGPDAP